ncbi:hypothetical protein B7463_g4409, partial [Scytalidium lignicola]
MSSSNSQASCLDPLDSLLDFSEYETVSYHSPSMTPTTKQTFSRPVTSSQSAPSTLPSVSQPTLSGPSHQYDLYRQQTGIPQGAVASTLAVNSSNAHLNNSYNFNEGYLSGLSPTEDFVDFGSAPGMTPFSGDMEMETKFEPNEPAFFFPERSSSEFVDPSAIGGSLSSTTTLPSQPSNVGRLWPGMHQQQAALAKAQAQQKQQQQIIAQQRQGSVASQSRPRPRAHPPTDPIVEEKITQLLNSMRQSSVATESTDDQTPSTGTMSNMHRTRKDEEDMDEDERLLASEEGKKLSSKERRQLRNKVSARAFRSRRKEYIGQLEGEIASKVNENSDLRRQNRLLMEENTRLSDLTRMLLSSPSFSGFLDQISTNPGALQQSTSQQQPQAQHQQQQQQVQAPTQQQIRKDPNPYAANQHMQQQIGLAMIPEQSVDFSMLDLTSDGLYSYQPQVFSVLEMPETCIDTDVLSGKASHADAINPEALGEEKTCVPVIEHAPVEAEREISEAKSITPTPIEDAEFDSNPAFALYVDSPNPTSSTTSTLPLEIDTTPLFGIEPEKALARIELVIVSEDNSMDIASIVAFGQSVHPISRHGRDLAGKDTTFIAPFEARFARIAFILDYGHAHSGIKSDKNVPSNLEVPWGFRGAGFTEKTCRIWILSCRQYSSLSIDEILELRTESYQKNACADINLLLDFDKEIQQRDIPDETDDLIKLLKDYLPGEESSSLTLFNDKLLQKNPEVGLVDKGPQKRTATSSPSLSPSPKHSRKLGVPASHWYPASQVKVQWQEKHRNEDYLVRSSDTVHNRVREKSTHPGTKNLNVWVTKAPHEDLAIKAHGTRKNGEAFNMYLKSNGDYAVATANAFSD